jgi:hypothetical protein
MPAEVAEGVAIAVLSAIAAEPERLGRFVAITGLQSELARDASSDPGFLASVLDYVMTDDALLVDCATAIGEPPERISQAHHVLSPPI